MIYNTFSYLNYLQSYRRFCGRRKFFFKNILKEFRPGRIPKVSMHRIDEFMKVGNFRHSSFLASFNVEDVLGRPKPER